MTGALADFGATFRQWRIWYIMAQQDIQLRYRRSLLGPFWLSIAMAVQVLGIGLLYSEILNQPVGQFVLYIAASLLVWGLISGMIAEACNTLVESTPHLHALPIPTPVFAARMVQRNFIIFLHNLIVIAALMAYVGSRPTPALMAFPIGLFVVTVTCYFIAVGLGPLCLRFRDLTQVVVSALQVAFFVTPVIWQRGAGRLSAIFVDANPLYHLLQLIRAPLLGQWPTPLNWIASLAILFAAMLFAVITLAASRRKIFLWL